MSASSSPASSPSEPNSLLRWEDVENARTYEEYFRQRLGRGFNDLPAILISKDAFQALLRGEEALFAELQREAPEAVRDLYFTFSADGNGIVMGFNIERPDVGTKAIEFVRARKRTPDHEEWLKGLIENQAACRRLHFLWKEREAANA